MTLVARAPLKGDAKNAFPAAPSAGDIRITHVRLTIFPDGGSFLFNFAASAINLFTPGRFTSARLRTLTLRTPFALPSSSFSGSASIAPRKNASVTCSFPSTKTHSGPLESNAGVFHGLTYSSQSAAVFFTSARTAFITPEKFPAFFT